MKLNWAERWVVNNPLRVMQQRLEMRYLKGMVSLEEGSVILEVGCGRGAGVRLIKEAFEPSRLFALDLDIRMVGLAKGYVGPESMDRVSLYVGDVFRLPFKDESLDAVFGFGVLHHIPDWRGALGEIARVLKRGGFYFFEELYPTLYQNFITRHIMVHPEGDRFFGDDLREALMEAKLPLTKAGEIKMAGILGVARKEE